MMDHPYQQHETFSTRDHCEAKYDDDGRVGHCGQPKSAHVVISDLKPRELGCGCHQEEGDSPCRVHGEEKLAPLFEKGPLGVCDVGPASRVEPHPKDPHCFHWRPVKAEKPERKRWPRKVGWTKVLARRKACKHFFVLRGTDPNGVCPDCLADEVAYWKGRTHSAEGQRDAMIRHAEKALVEVYEARQLIAQPAQAVSK